MDQGLSASDAIQDFHHARWQATLLEVIARLMGTSSKPLSFDDVSQKLSSVSSLEKGVQKISLEAIVGSCGRYED